MSTKKSALQQELVTLYRKALLRGVALEEIEEKIQKQLDRISVIDKVEADFEKKRERRVINRVPKIVRLGAFVVPVALLSFGIYLVGSAVFPIMAYYVQTSPALQTSSLLAPIPRSEVMDVTPLVIDTSGSVAGTISSSDEDDVPIIIDEELDYTNLSNWFTGSLPELATGQVQRPDIVKEFTLDIPSLDIYNAKVKIGGTDLNNSLISYEGTALPGNPGAPVIFGHSVLRQFYNPSEKNPRRYNSIFSTIMTMKNGDEIIVTYDGVKYRYIVQEKAEVQPEDVYILTQQYDARQLKLVTCTPEGTYLRRGVVTAQLVQ
ncbi:MAG: sortase [Pseudomonadales bacterium]|nr:sortase [Candidatus Woesebacteria bacterium]MCB9801257.1 sortase [Pseudomonadales bacterium]